MQAGFGGFLCAVDGTRSGDPGGHQQGVLPGLARPFDGSRPNSPLLHRHPLGRHHLGPKCRRTVVAGVHKAAAIAVVLDHLGFDQADSIAFGDNLNDLEMLQFAGVGVAMGQASDRVKAVADEVTGSPDEDGIRDGFARHGLLGTPAD